MTYYDRDDIANYLSIKCNINKNKALEIIKEHYNFIKYIIENGDCLNCYPLGKIEMKEMKPKHYKGKFMNKVTKELFIAEGTTSRYLKPVFKFAKIIKDDLKSKGTDIIKDKEQD